MSDSSRRARRRERELEQRQQRLLEQRQQERQSRQQRLRKQRRGLLRARFGAISPPTPNGQQSLLDVKDLFDQIQGR